MNLNFEFIQNLRNEAINVYHVDPYVFIVLYVITIPVYYYGDFLMFRAGYRYYKENFRGKKKFDLDDLLAHSGFLRGLIINRLGWVIPYVYIIFWGDNLPIWFYFLITFWLFVSSYFYIRKSHKNILTKDIVYKVANKGELLDARKLVSKRYYEVGYLGKKDSQKPFDDKYVKNSIYFIAKCNQEVVGAIRLVKNSNIGLPTTNEFKLYKKAQDSLSKVDQKSLVEIGNLAANPGHHIARGLYKQVITYCVENKLLPIASIDQNLLNYFLTKYWMLKPFYMIAGKPKYYVGSVSVPVVINPSKLMLLFL